MGPPSKSVRKKVGTTLQFSKLSTPNLPQNFEKSSNMAKKLVKEEENPYNPFLLCAVI